MPVFDTSENNWTEVFLFLLAFQVAQYEPPSEEQAAEN